MKNSMRSVSAITIEKRTRVIATTTATEEPYQATTNQHFALSVKITGGQRYVRDVCIVHTGLAKRYILGQSNVKQ